MENPIDPIRLLRFLRSGGESRSQLLANLTEAVQIWRETSGLAAYHVIVSALDSNDDEIRRLAEVCLNRRSPRPRQHRAHSAGRTLERDSRWKESA